MPLESGRKAKADGRNFTLLKMFLYLEAQITFIIFKLYINTISYIIYIMYAYHVYYITFNN